MPEPTRNRLDVLAPVPVSRSRMRTRGYNQSELLARKIAELTGVTLSANILVRTGQSSPQARANSIAERAENVIGAFSVTGETAGMRILLIDDVMTTGATLNSCARALKDTGASWVGALVLAREL